MKLLGCLFLIIGVCSLGVQAQEVSVDLVSNLHFNRSPIEETGENAFNETIPVKPALSPIIPLTEVLFQNVFVWWWDRYVIDKHYAQTNLRIWKRNFEEGWTWDNNHFAINFFGHPVQGMFYYQAARSAGYSFYSSFFYTLIGSYTWEMFAEREYPSVNDLITTSVGGAIYGEVFFRLSQRILANPNHNYWDESRAFVLSPLGYLQRKALGARTHNPGYAPLDLSTRVGGGIRFGNEYRYDGRSDNDWNQESGFVGFNLIYGRPNKTIKKPFDYFTVDFTQDYGADGMLFHLETTGKLKNYNMNSGHNYTDIASYLHFDTFYGDLV